MKRGDIIKITDSKPAKGQDGIAHLIGHEYPIKEVDLQDGRPTGRVSIDANPDGEIVLQRDEYQFMRSVDLATPSANHRAMRKLTKAKSSGAVMRARNKE